MANIGGAVLQSNAEYSVENNSGLRDLEAGSVSLLSEDSLTFREAKHGGSSDLKELYKQAADITAVFHLLENNTRVAEKNLVDSFNMSKASTQLNIQKAKYVEPTLLTTTYSWRFIFIFTCQASESSHRHCLLAYKGDDLEDPYASGHKGQHSAVQNTLRSFLPWPLLVRDGKKESLRRNKY